MMFRSSACLALALFAGSAIAANDLKSGPQPGEPNNRSGFKPNLVAGAFAGQRLCPV